MAGRSEHPGNALTRDTEVIEDSKEFGDVEEPTVVRMIVSSPRSGSTLLMRIFAESSDCAVTSRLILMRNYGSDPLFSPDYTILCSPKSLPVFQAATAEKKKFLITKEELGNDRLKGECSYKVLPNLKAYRQVKPVILIRDPIHTFESWKNVGWCDVDSLVECYQNMYQMLLTSPHGSAQYLLYERLIHMPHAVIERVCNFWGVPYSEDLLQFTKPFGSFSFASERERTIYTEEKPLGLFANVEAHSSIVPNLPSHGLLTHEEVVTIESRVGREYMRLWNTSSEIEPIRKALKQATWFAFDLDDTLHGYRKASAHAMQAVLAQVSETQQIPLKDLETEYVKFQVNESIRTVSQGNTCGRFCHKTISAVLDTSRATRKEADPEFMEQLCHTFEKTYIEALELKPDIVVAFDHLQQMGKKIVVISESPPKGTSAESEEIDVANMESMTLRDRTLFLERNIDGLTKLLESKADVVFPKESSTRDIAADNHGEETGRLFPNLLRRLDIAAEDMVYIGDDHAQGLAPAMECGIFSINLAEHEGFNVFSTPVKINTVGKLIHMLEIW
ncbi:hypothetical protein FKW77_000431 [Venturia effusa]|uniref:Uncharacterized protein n=1 Tax=Venturia effusa TaxID=50376 RepID=A0A517LQM6_9PEZI|nr:hypothetical protein FKW77_000431 [Venturia effusa]